MKRLEEQLQGALVDARGRPRKTTRRFRKLTAEEWRKCSDLRAKGMTTRDIAAEMLWPHNRAKNACAAMSRGDPLHSADIASANAVSRFKSNLVKDGDCLVWIGPVARSGYGKVGFKVGGLSPDSMPHRVAYLLEHGALPERPLIVRHTCDNRLCCNPDHLLSGTYKDNARDMVVRGRHASMLGAPSRNKPEQILQKQLFDFLTLALPSGALIWHAHNTPRSKIDGARLVSMGLKAGMPDLMIFLDGSLYGLELKSPKGKLTEAQKDVASAMVSNGGFWAEIRSLEQAEAFLEEQGVPLRARVSA